MVCIHRVVIHSLDHWTGSYQAGNYYIAYPDYMVGIMILIYFIPEFSRNFIALLFSSSSYCFHTLA